MKKLGLLPLIAVISTQSGFACRDQHPPGQVKPYVPNWHLSVVQAQEAWAALAKSAHRSDTVVIAIIDDGFNARHSDLVGRGSVNVRERDGKPGKDDEFPFGNGYPDDVLGWNFHSHTPSTSAGYVESAHGLSVAGLAVADSLEENEDKFSSLGVCPLCYYIPIVRGQGDSGMAVAIEYALLRKADIILGSLASKEYKGPATEKAIWAAATEGRNGKGAVLVFSAGNFQQKAPGYPAAYEPVIAVGASDCQGAIWEYSHRNSDLVAPSGPHPSQPHRCGLTTPAAGRMAVVSTFGGTSGAAPIVAGVAGLVLLANPHLSAKEVLGILARTATQLPRVSDEEQGSGQVNACRAVAEALRMAGNAAVWNCPTREVRHASMDH